MTHYKSGAELAAGLGVPTATIKATFDAYNAAAEAGSHEPNRDPMTSSLCRVSAWS